MRIFSFTGQRYPRKSCNVDNGNRFQVSICSHVVQADGQADSLC